MKTSVGFQFGKTLNKSSVVSLLFICCMLGGWVSCQQQDVKVDFTLEDRKQLGKHLLVEKNAQFVNRVTPIPDMILQVWKNADLAMNPQANQYKNYTLTNQEKGQLEAAFQQLPKAWLRLMNAKLTRIFFVKDLLGAGIADWLVDEHGDVVYTLILNPALFYGSAKGWLEHRANSSFVDGDYRLVIEGLDGVSALQYALWHEGAHVMDYANKTTIIDDEVLNAYLNIHKQTTSFTKGVWDTDKTAPLAGLDFATRKKLNPYRMNAKKAQLENSVLLQTFSDLQKTPFVTPYASSSWAEDYADYMVFKLATSSTGNKPYWLLKKGEQVTSEFHPLEHTINQERQLHAY